MYVNETIEYFPKFNQTFIPTLMALLAIINGCVRYRKRQHILNADSKTDKRRHAILVLACFDRNLNWLNVYKFLLLCLLSY